MVQGGDPKGDGSGGPGYTLPDEPPKNGYKAGSVAMANSGPDTTGRSSSSVTDERRAGLGGPPYQYSSLGTVTKGMDVVAERSLTTRARTRRRRRTDCSPLYINKVTITES